MRPHPDAESVYAHLPVPLQDLAVTCVGLRTRRTRYGAPFAQHLEAAVERESWAEEQLADYRDARLRSTLRLAATRVPFYADSLAAATVASFRDLHALPLLTRHDVREAGARLHAAHAGVRPLRTHTSGTTGTAMHLLTCLDAVQEQWAVFWRFARRHGIAFGTPCGLFAGRSVVPAGQQRPPYWRWSRATRQVVFSGYHLNDATLPAYLDELRRRRLPWLHGYPSLLTLVAGYLCDTGFDLGYAPRAVTTSSETLLPHQRRVIEQAFGVVPRQHYGNTEAVASISECEAGGLHVDEDFAAVELLPTDMGFELVGTTLWNPVMPLVRYCIGDLVQRETSCGCGRPSRVVDAVDGRIESYIVLRDGTRLGRMDHLFKDLVNVREAQIYQPRAGEIVFRVVRGAQFGRDDEQLLMREAVKRIGERASIELEYRDELVRETGSKLRFVVSDLEQGQVARTTV